VETQSTHLTLQVLSTLVLLKQLVELLLLMVQTGFTHLHLQEHLLHHLLYLLTTLSLQVVAEVVAPQPSLQAVAVLVLEVLEQQQVFLAHQVLG
jgi:hypothetical protein